MSATERRRRFLSAVLLSVFGLMSARCSRVSEPTNQKELAGQFEAFFGFRPPPTVTELRSKRVQIGDSLTDWISFRCDQSVFSEITHSKQLRTIDADGRSGGPRADIPQFAVSHYNAPRWWPASPELSMRRLFYLPANGAGTGWNREFYFWREEVSGNVFAFYHMSR